MALYYFEVCRDGEEPEVDRDGTDLPDLAGVRSHVVSLLPRIVGSALLQGLEHDFVCIARDAASGVRFKTLISIRCEAP